MRYLSVCSGIEAATVAWHHMGWQPVAFSDIEPFPSAVLAHHYPHVPNLGDMTKFEEWNLESVDLLVGGTPCQSFSVAGLRKGLADPRGNLMLTFLAIAQRQRPRWIVWENVPGVLSSNGGRDFGTFLGALGELGYGFAYRVLDAQWFGVAQRRRRVFVVGCLGDWQRPAQVLFERESVRRDTAPSREKGQEVAAFIRDSTPGRWWDGSDVAATLTKQNANGAQRMPDKDNFGAVLQPITFGAQMSVPQTDVDLVQTLQAKNPMAVAQPVIYQDSQYGVGEYATAGSLRAGRIPEHQMVAQPVAFDSYNLCETGDITQTIKSPQGGVTESVGAVLTAMQVAPALTASNDPSRSPQSSEVTQQVEAVHSASMQVRRLTPVECERLQGFPDNYTNIPWRKKPESPDGPRYKALGNSMAVPVMRWIGERINNAEKQ